MNAKESLPHALGANFRDKCKRLILEPSKQAIPTIIFFYIFYIL